MKEKQQEVQSFIEKHDLEGETAYRILDLVAEVGEIAADAAKSSDYGVSEENLEVKKDEIGDAFFSLFAVSSDLGIDAEEALEQALLKYQERMETKGDPGSR